MTTLESLRELIEMASNLADSLFAERHCINPMWFAVKSDGDVMIIPPPCDDRDLAVAMVRALFEIADIRACIFVDEAWMLGGEFSPQETKRIRARGVVDHPQRVEIILFSAENDAGTMFGHRRIERRKTGKPHLGPLVIEDLTGWNMEGRLIGMLPARGTRQ